MKFYTKLTTAGVAAFTEAAMTDTPISIIEMAIGDGGGKEIDPGELDNLVNEVYRAPLNRLVITDRQKNVIQAEMIMLPQVGGFWMREAALYDDKGICLAVASLPESYKPKLDEGSGRLSAVNIYITVSDTADVNLIADPAIILATVDEVNKAKGDAKDYTDDIAATIYKAIDDAIRAAWELDNPIGTSRLFNSNIDPNTRWPWSTWEYAGEHVTIRTAAADGSDVGALGGSDTVNIARGNLPAETIGLSGTTEEHGAQTLQTKPAGKHAHMAGVRAPGAEYSTSNIGTDADQPHKLGWTSDEGEHVHEYDIPAHQHPFSGRTENLGNGQPLQIVERHKLQMLWHRVA